VSIFVDEVAKKLADQWARLIVLPGLLYVAVLGLVWPLSIVRTGSGLRSGLCLALLPRHVREFILVAASSGAAAVAVAAVLVLVTSLLVGQAAEVLARLIEALWLGSWPAWPRNALIRQRSRRWQRRQAEIDRLLAQGREHIDIPALATARIQRDAIAPTRPQHPTWMGDRFASLELLLDNTYHVPLRPFWSRLWLVLPDRSRDDVQFAAQVFREQTLAAGWGLMYLATAAYWWPLLVPGLLMILVSWRRGRRHLDGFAAVVEATVDLYMPDLARALGIDVDGPFTPAVGDEMRALMVKTE
jgi:hypothetical protein